MSKLQQRRVYFWLMVLDTLVILIFFHLTSNATSPPDVSLWGACLLVSVGVLYLLSKQLRRLNTPDREGR